MKLRVGDTVAIIAGKDKGKTGAVLRVLPRVNRVVVAGINMRTKHVKKTFQQAGQKLTYEASIHASNVMVLDPKTKKPTRIGTKVDAKGRKVRIAKGSGEEIVKVKAPAAKKDGEKAEKTTKKKAEEKVDAAKPQGKQPFWKRVTGGTAAEGAEVDEPSRMQQDHSVPAEQTHSRHGSRGQ